MKNLDTVVKYDSPFLEFVQTRYVDQAGQIKKWNWCRRPNGTKAVVIAAIVDIPKNTIMGMSTIPHLVVIKEFRVPLNDYEYGFPAGLIDPGESIESAIRRELEEETGLKITKINHISPPVVSSAGISDESIYMAYVRATGTPNKEKLEASEDIETMLLTRGEVCDLLQTPGIIFGKSAYCVMKCFSEFGSI